MNGLLEGKVALVTNAHQGIGLEIMKALVHEGITVAAVSYQLTTPRMRQVTSEAMEKINAIAACKSPTLTSFAIELDVKNERGLTYFFPKLDIELKECAGSNKIDFVINCDEILGTSLFIENAIPRMCQGGRIIILSDTEIRNFFDAAAHAATYSLNSQVIAQLAKELKPLGITVNSIVPPPNDKDHASLEWTPWDNTNKPAIARFVASLVSPSFSRITGQTIMVSRSLEL